MLTSGVWLKLKVRYPPNVLTLKDFQLLWNLNEFRTYIIDMLKTIQAIIVILTFAFGLSACSQPSPEEEVKLTIDEMIEVLESGDRQVILQKYAKIPPGKDITTRDFSEDKAEQLMAYLKQAKQAKPTMSEDKKTATFDIQSTHRELVFSKIDGQWKLNN